MDKVHIVCPSISDLEEDCKKNICCPVAGCGKILPQKQSLKFHIVKVHGIIKDAADWSIAKHVKLKQTSDVVSKFLCPSRGCQYAENGSKYFTSSKLLKQHYMKVHATKRYSCITCSSLFGLHRDLTRHEKACRQRILCATCHIAFTNQEDLKSHCQLTQHNINTSHDKETGDVNEAEKLQGDNDSDSGIGETAKQLQMKVSTAIEAINSVASPPPNIDQQHSQNEMESTDVVGRGNGCLTNSTAVNSPVEQHMCQCSGVSVSKAVVNTCHKNSTESHRNSRINCTSVSAELTVSKQSSITVRESPNELLPKPTYTLLPVTVGIPLLVVVNAVTVHSSSDHRLLPAVVPHPASVSSSLLVPPVSHKDSSSLAISSSNSLHGDVWLPRKQKSVTSVVTQTSSLLARPRRKTAAAATQTCGSVATVSRLSKVSRSSQVSSRVRQKRPCDMQHSHTQTHGTNRKLRRIAASQSVGVAVPSLGTETQQWWPSDMSNSAVMWPDMASNATQTVSCVPTKLESIRTQTVESFLSSSQQEDLLDFASQILSESVGSSCESSCAFAVQQNSSITTASASSALSVNMSKPAIGSGDFLPSDAILSDICTQLIDEHHPISNVTQTVQTQESAENEVFDVNCIGSQTLSPLVDQLMDTVEDVHEQGTSCSSRLSRVMLTSASQTMPDFDAVSTQTMDCDFDGDIDIDDFDEFIHTETQTTDMLASYFSFADIETQTGSDMQYWDSETQTSFDVFLSSSRL